MMAVKMQLQEFCSCARQKHGYTALQCEAKLQDPRRHTAKDIFIISYIHKHTQCCRTVASVAQWFSARK